MRTIRSVFGTRSRSWRVLVGIGTGLVLIAGLLAMHTLTPDVSSPPTNPSAAASAPRESAVAHPGDAPHSREPSGHCAGDCHPGGMPEHSLMLMVCVLALLAAVILVLAPARLGRPVLVASIAAHLEDAVRALPRAKPPSLLVLSISRT